MEALQAAKVLYREFVKAYLEARDLRDQVTTGYTAFAAGRGVAPDQELIDECEAQEALVDRLKVELDRVLDE